MSNKPITIFISAAEPSGDLHAAHLIRSIREKLGDVRFVGVAGEKMAAAGCEVLADLSKKASMLGGPLLRLGYYVRTLRRLQRQIREIKPDVFIPVDSPALNWHLAATAKSIGIKVVYYVAPQVWAWAPWRVRKLARLTDHVACILPFEQRYLRDRGVNATYVGHPLFDFMPPAKQPLPDLAEAWSEGLWRVALLPGSRQSEISGHTPAFAKIAKKICRKWNKARCVFVARDEETAEKIRKLIVSTIEEIPDQIEIKIAPAREVLADSHFAIAASGTVTLEVAHFGVPMVVLYRTGLTGYLYYLTRRWMFSTPNLSLVNILAGKRLVPELMPWHGNYKKLKDIVMEVICDFGWLNQARQELLEVVKPLHVKPPAKASDNAAELILKELSKA